MKCLHKFDGVWHFIVSAILFVISIVALYYFQSVCVIPVVVIIIVNAYILLVLLECAKRSDDDFGGPKIIGLPNRVDALAELLVLVAVVVLSFASLYIHNNVIYTVGFDPTKCPTYITEKSDAIYFSIVTIATVGYGDYVPIAPARYIVMWEIVTGILMLLFALPLVVGRIASWTNKTYANDTVLNCRKSKFDSHIKKVNVSVADWAEKQENGKIVFDTANGALPSIWAAWEITLRQQQWSVTTLVSKLNELKSKVSDNAVSKIVDAAIQALNAHKE